MESKLLYCMKCIKSTRGTVIDVEPDRISSLPDHLIDLILSHLPIKEAVRTSVLSREWKKKWYTLPNLVFDEYFIWDCDLDFKFIFNIVNHVLLLHSGPIEVFKFIDMWGKDICDSGVIDLNRWIVLLIEKSIKELAINVLMYKRYKIPWCLFSCQSLHHLDLQFCSLKPPTTFDGLKNLKNLHLNSVKVSQDAFENLISGCPLLEILKLICVNGFTQINIDAPNLKSFEIWGEFVDIRFENSYQLATILLNSYSNEGRSSSNLLNFLDQRPHIQSLFIDGYSLKCFFAGIVPEKLLSPCIALNFLCLKITFDDLNEILAALSLVRSSPNLQKLEINAQASTPISYCWDDIFSAPDMPIQVRHITINDISGFNSEIDFIRFLLLHSPVLEKMIVNPLVKAKPEMMLELIRFKRASRGAEVIIDEEDYQNVW